MFQTVKRLQAMFQCLKYVIAAANISLSDQIAGRRLREIFFYRLNVVALDLPPLRERAEHIPLLVNRFIEKLNRSKGKNINTQVLQMLIEYPFPGNVRERQ